MITEAKQTEIENRVLVLFSTHKDGAICQQALRLQGIASTLCLDAYQLCRELTIGASVVVLTEESFSAPECDALLAVLGNQEPWSDIPIIALMQHRTSGAPRTDILDRFVNLVLLPRPLGIDALITAVRSGMRSRQRQYQVREYLAERKRNEDALRESEERYRSLFKHTPDGIAHCRMLYENGSPQDLIYLDVNDAFDRLTGLKDVVGKKISEVIPGIQQSNPELFQIYGRVALTGQPERFETYVESLGIWFLITVYSPRKEHFVAVFDNITERKRMQDSVAADLEAMRRLHQTAALSAQPDVSYDAMLAQFLEAAIAIAGADKGNLQVCDPASGALKIKVHHGFEEPFLKFFENVRHEPAVCGTARQHRERVIVEDVMESPILKGTPALAVLLEAGVRSVHSTPLVSSAGHVLGIISTHFGQPHRFPERDLRLFDLLGRQAADFIERKQGEEALRESEERYRAFVTASSEVLYRMSPDWSEMRELYSRGFLANTERPSRTWVQEYIPPEDQSHVLARIQEAISSKRIFELEHRVLRADGGIGWTFSRAVPMINDKGEIVEWFGAASNITERKQAENALRKAKDELIRANEELECKVRERTAKLNETVEELEHFSYTITHDMRAPLRAMQGFGQLLLGQCEDCLHPQRREFLRKIAESASRMDSLITDALNYTKIVRKEFPLEPLNTDKLLRSMVESYPQFQPPRAEISIEGNLPVVLGNEAAMTQCFSNLLGNAIKFVQPGKVPKVRVWAENRGANLRLWFEDNGIGIANRHQEQIFVMFQRLSRDYEGTGIGLALVSKAVERMQGHVGVESEEGQGSRFWIELKSCESTTPTYAREAAAVH